MTPLYNHRVLSRLLGSQGRVRELVVEVQGHR